MVVGQCFLCYIVDAVFKIDLHPPPPGGGGAPYDGQYGEAPPERAIFCSNRARQIFDGTGVTVICVPPPPSLPLQILSVFFPC